MKKRKVHRKVKINPPRRREGALGYKVNGKAREGALGYLIWTVIIWLISFLIVGAYMLQWLPLSNTALIILTVVILLGAIKYPRQFFWLFLAVLPLENIILSAETVPIAIRPFQLIGGILVVVLLLSTIIKNIRVKKLLRPTLPSLAIFRMEKTPVRDSQIYLNPVDRLVLFLGVASLIGAQFAPNFKVSLKLSVILFSFLAFYWAARNFTRNFKNLLEGIWFFLVGADVVLFFGFYQKIAEKFGWTSFQIMEKRINSTFTEPNWLGMYLVFLLALILGTKYILKLLRKDDGCLGKTAQRFSRLMISHWSILKVVQFSVNIGVFFIIAELVLTVSRSAWLGAGVVLGVYTLIIFIKEGYKKSSQTIFFASIKIALVIFLLNILGLSDFHLANRATSSASGLQKITISCQPSKRNIANGDKIKTVEELGQYNCRHINLEEIDQEKQRGGVIKEVYRPDPSINVRKDIYKKSWIEIKKNWLFGQGLGSSGFFLGKDNLGHNLSSSNIFLEVLLSMGVAGLAIFILILATPLVVGLKLLQIKSGKYAKRPQEVIAVFFILTFFAFLIPNLFNSGLLISFFWIWLAMVMSYLSME